MLNAEISRARDRAELVTDDKAGLAEQIKALTGERIAALEALGADGAKGLDAEGGRESARSPEGPQPDPERAKEAEMTPLPKSADLELGL